MYHFVDENPNWYAHLVMLHRTSPFKESADSHPYDWGLALSIQKIAIKGKFSIVYFSVRSNAVVATTNSLLDYFVWVVKSL